MKRADAGSGPVFAETVGAFRDVVLRVGLDSGLVCATFVIPSAGIAPGGLRCAVVGDNQHFPLMIHHSMSKLPPKPIRLTPSP